MKSTATILVLAALALAVHCRSIPIQQDQEQQQQQQQQQDEMGAWMERTELIRKALKRKPVEPKVFNVSLDLPAEERWVHVAEQFKSEAWKIKWYVTQYVPNFLWPVLELIASDVRTYFKDYGDEMIGLAKGLDVNVGDVVIVNLIYQLESIGTNCSAWNTTGECPDSSRDGPGMCTSLVAKDENNKILHGRNLDWNLDDKLLDLVMTVNYQRGGKTVHTSSSIIGMTGILNGIRHDGFGISVNARGRGGKIYVNLAEALALNARTPTQHARYTMENADNFDEAISVLGQHALVDDMYYTVSGIGPEEGAIVSRSRNSVADTWYINGTSSHDVSNNPQEPWFKLETNYDHWLSPPTMDDRRDPGVKLMKEMGQKNATLDNIYTILQTWPVFNHHTDLTALMCPKDNTFRAFVWRDESD